MYDPFMYSEIIPGGYVSLAIARSKHKLHL